MEERVKAIKAGNLHVYENIIDEYQQRIYCYILKMTRDPEESKDLTQEVFITLYEKINQYHEDISFLAWIYKIARNKTLNHLKKEKFRRGFNLYKANKISYEEAFFEELNGFDSRIEESLDKLSLDDKNILLMKSVEELSYEELSKIYGVSVVNMRKRYERARKKFAKHYDEKIEVNNYA